MKVGIITQWYPPDPAFVPAELGAELAARGHQVRVLAGFPNYSVGRTYPAYRAWCKDEVAVGGVTTRRVPLHLRRDPSGVHRAGNRVAYAAAGSLAALRFLASVDVVYVYLTPTTVAMATALLRALPWKPSVIHVQDLWPESGRIVRQAMRSVCRSATSIAVAAPSMRAQVIGFGAAPATVRVVLNWADEATFHPVGATAATRAAIGHRDRCTIMYAGAMGPLQNVVDPVRAAAAVEGTGQVDLVVIGSGVEEASGRALAAQLGVGNVRFLGRRAPSQLAALYGAADYQLVALRDRPAVRGTIPSKLPAALSCGLPVVVSAPGGCTELVERGGLGLACPPEDWPALADRFMQAATLPSGVRAEMSRRARDSYHAQMSKRAGVDRLERMLLQAARPSAAR